MIVTVTANPALDLTWHVERIVAGGTHRADTGAARAGGKGLNVARVAHAQGAPVRAITTVGGATGAEFADELTAAGVPHVLVPVAASTRRSIALVDEALGDTTIINERGVAPTASEWEALKAAVADALRADARVLVISGSFPPATPDDVLPALIALGRNAGAVVIADTSGPSLLQAADAGASVLKPNEHELRDATGLADPLDGARELLRRGAELVLLSQGADGMLAITASAADPDLQVLHARLDRVLAGNPTGAGDAAVAACAVLMDAGIHDPEKILRRATAWSAAAVLMPLAGEIHPSCPDLERDLIVVPAAFAPATHAEKPLPARETASDVVSHADSGFSPAAGAPAPDSPASGAPTPASDRRNPR
ncbi:Tagatose 1,6-bisphosphate aldolase [Microbacterium esteraromaticum]|uniref:Tagatose 1,6-bisphosphate aldolase n=1 Tax=Microbacterium esteraromaticum TaxID=57043 RepID=A0A1R4K290_9MICO|nr:1-phosphofructokinase family hexose kinase [Microbacterium esteraromaticum]SJN38386.1 Tagatose 1,6-bisphosphate aldolase [Microbacterium esteraromaticum]